MLDLCCLATLGVHRRYCRFCECNKNIISDAIIDHDISSLFPLSLNLISSQRNCNSFNYVQVLVMQNINCINYQLQNILLFFVSSKFKLLTLIKIKKNGLVNYRYFLNT